MRMKNGVFSEYKIFAGNSNPELAEEIAAIMGKPLGKSTVSKFSDGEISGEPLGKCPRRGCLYHPVYLQSYK